MSNEIQPFFGKEREVRTAQEHLFGSRGRLLLMLCLALTLLGSLVNAAPVSSHVDAYSTQDENPRYWITASSGKTHNSSCRPIRQGLQGLRRSFKKLNLPRLTLTQRHIPQKTRLCACNTRKSVLYSPSAHAAAVAQW